MDARPPLTLVPGVCVSIARAWHGIEIVVETIAFSNSYRAPCESFPSCFSSAAASFAASSPAADCDVRPSDPGLSASAFVSGFSASFCAVSVAVVFPGVGVEEAEEVCVSAFPASADESAAESAVTSLLAPVR